MVGPRLASRLVAAALLVLSTAALALQNARADLATTGKWSPGLNWDIDPNSANHRGYAISLNLLRGDGAPFHSRIRWWSHDNSTTTVGGDWGWKAGAEDCSIYPDTSIYFRAFPLGTSGIDIFCSGATTLPDGRLLITGGNNPETDTYGEKRARIWSPGVGLSSGAWATPGDMKEWRWYPTTTALADGRVLVLSGIHHQKHTYFGGKRNGSIPTGSVADSVALFSPVEEGQWEPSVIPAADPVYGRPVARWLHSGNQMTTLKDYDGQLYYGGVDATGSILGDTWQLVRDPAMTERDFAYRWSKLVAASPPLRSEHSAIAATFGSHANLIVFGGLDEDSIPSSDTYYLSKSAGTFTWAKVTHGMSSPPSARYGQSAIYDESTIGGTLCKRLIVFGGSNSSHAVLPDTNLYELRFSSEGVGSWTTMTKRNLGYGSPSGRSGHMMGIDLVSTRPKVVGGATLNAHAAFMYGGQRADNTYSNELWILWIFDDGTVGWEDAGHGSDIDAPTACKRGSLLVDPYQGHGSPTQEHVRIYLFGGENALGPVSADEYVLDPFDVDHEPWEKWAASGRTSSGQSVTIDNTLSTARVAETFDPAQGTSGQFTSHTSANLFQPGFPITFVLPKGTTGSSTGSGRVVSMGYDGCAYALDVAAGGSSPGWAKLNNTCLDFTAEAAVMYEPGKIMVSGLVDSAGIYISRTKRIDLSPAAIADSAWHDGAPAHGTGSLLARRFHNMVILPNGKVLAIGGLASFAQSQYDKPTFRPQLWDPVTGWSDTSVLAAQPRIRDYHSTAMLLPDARVLSAGGQQGGANVFGEIYCPPYLFSAETLATRPTLVAATGRWRYNSDVTFAVSGDTAIRSACLIRAPATTHAFDESQRFVPLGPLTSSVRGDGVRQFFFKAPPDSFTAPPGDYMLFVNDKFGVPSIAQWVRMGSVYAGQFDSRPPDTLIFGAEFVTCDKIYLNWLAPGDDSLTGTALDYDVRYSTSPVTSSTFSSNSRLGNLPIPLLVGTAQKGDSLVGLQFCTWYYFGGKTRDRSENWSAIGRTRLKTLCTSPCYTDPGEAAHRSRDESDLLAASSAVSGGVSRVKSFAAPAELSVVGSTLRLVANCTKGDEVSWSVSYQDLAGNESLLESTANQLVVQEPLQGGGWAERSVLTVSPGKLGVRSLLRGGRVVFPVGTTLQTVEAAPQAYLCTQASHSRLGNLLETGSALDSVSIEASSGDTLRLAFSANESSTGGEDQFFCVRIPGSERSTVGRRLPRVPTSRDLPTAFALFPARPNPFSNSTVLRFDLPRTSQVKIEIFDVQGRRVSTLVNETREAGRHSVNWSGSTSVARPAVAGVYLCRMTANGFVSERRVVLVP